VTLQPGQPADAALINEIQQAIATLSNNRRVVWRQARLPAGATSASSVNDGDIQLSDPGDYLVELPLVEGDRLRTVRMVGSTLAGATMTAVLYKRSYAAASPGQSRVQIGSALGWAPAETEIRREIDVLAAVPDFGEEIVLQDDSGDPTDITYWLYVSNTGGTAKIHSVKVLVEERPVLVQP
jgi:hypothetical protein